jgi:2-polyprenyl-3-methyl-5-hydroxy-6-metoxy-1,4-benzoquinol methylase
MSSELVRYDAIADWYVEFTKDWDSEPLALLPGDARGLRVLDLACGYGTASRHLARRGARVTGLDISAALLSRARQMEAGEPLGIRYLQGDAACMGRAGLRRRAVQQTWP